MVQLNRNRSKPCFEPKKTERLRKALTFDESCSMFHSPSFVAQWLISFNWEPMVWRGWYGSGSTLIQYSVPEFNKIDFVGNILLGTDLVLVWEFVKIRDPPLFISRLTKVANKMHFVCPRQPSGCAFCWQFCCQDFDVQNMARQSCSTDLRPSSHASRPHRPWQRNHRRATSPAQAPQSIPYIVYRPFSLWHRPMSAARDSFDDAEEYEEEEYDSGVEFGVRRARRDTSHQHRGSSTLWTKMTWVRYSADDMRALMWLLWPLWCRCEIFGFMRRMMDWSGVKRKSSQIWRERHHSTLSTVSTESKIRTCQQNDFVEIDFVGKNCWLLIVVIKSWSWSEPRQIAVGRDLIVVISESKGILKDTYGSSTKSPNKMHFVGFGDTVIRRPPILI